MSCRESRWRQWKGTSCCTAVAFDDDDDERERVVQCGHLLKVTAPEDISAVAAAAALRRRKTVDVVFVVVDSDVHPHWR